MYSAKIPMTLLEILIIFFAIIGTYAALVYILHKKKILQKYNISFYGPMLMWRTKKGILLLKRIARRRRFWKSFGNAGIIFCFLTLIKYISIMIYLHNYTNSGLKEILAKESLPPFRITQIIDGLYKSKTFT